MEEKTYRVNERIRSPSVRLIGPDGQQMGIVSREAALAAAREAGLDLVEVAPNDNPPVCRILDFGKFKYMQKKKQQKSHAAQMKVKEIRVRPGTGEADLNVKINRAREFLTKGDKVLISVMFRGREAAHMEEGEKVLNHILERLMDLGRLEGTINRQSKRIVCTVLPNAKSGS
ncbi:MAG: translation initiation factor IF-3 [Thermogutta sp.]|uniref:translation initiation factor IF-3 n=1 Tax=Thermogutta sp. TaxID=1962930 RepID=UPI0019B0473C|nr:translation initiation factor IF-3 [Thermogutta sp.]MBC7353891.1 translation initiation factor IF-3 [Thermogutta sp.]